jgi:hypothetical protein
MKFSRRPTGFWGTLLRMLVIVPVPGAVVWLISRRTAGDRLAFVWACCFWSLFLVCVVLSAWLYRVTDFQIEFDDEERFLVRLDRVLTGLGYERQSAEDRNLVYVWATYQLASDMLVSVAVGSAHVRGPMYMVKKMQKALHSSALPKH